MRLEQYQVDAFAAQIFKGNPAAVIILDSFLPSALMQSIAQENNLSETVFAVPRAQTGHYDLRWFTPSVEIAFCGHATLATAHILWSELSAPRDSVSGAYEFYGQIGALSVSRDKSGLYALSAPQAKARAVPLSSDIIAAFARLRLTSAFTAGPNLYCVCERAQALADHAPDFAAIAPLSAHGVALTAPAGDFKGGGYDFVSRFFAPAEGINEDPVTGSAHAALAPYWADKLGKAKMKAYQASQRGGELYLEIAGSRVLIKGHAVSFMRGEIYLPG